MARPPYLRVLRRAGPPPATPVAADTWAALDEGVSTVRDQARREGRCRHCGVRLPSAYRREVAAEACPDCLRAIRLGLLP